MLKRCSLLLLLAIAVQCGRHFKIRNSHCTTIWVGIQGDPGNTSMYDGGFILEQSQHLKVKVDQNWSGRIWARTWCDISTGYCQTGDCGSKLKCAGDGPIGPVSVAAITLNGKRGLDYYKIVLTDGFNLRISVSPIGGTGDGTKYSCKQAACLAPIEKRCPGELRFMGGINGTEVIGCESPCEAFNTDDICCRGAYSADNCTVSQSNYTKFFKEECPDTFGYTTDNPSTSLFSCQSKKYFIAFG